MFMLLQCLQLRGKGRGTCMGLQGTAKGRKIVYNADKNKKAVL